MNSSPRVPHRFDALLAEDVITPMHHHVEGQDFLVAQTPDGLRRVTPTEADAIAAECSLVRDHSEVEIADDGPVGLRDNGIRRRSVLGGATLGLGALLAASSTPRYAFAATTSTTRDTLVVIFLRGGMDGLSAVVPVTDSSYYAARQSIAVRDSSVVRLNDQYGLHPAMSALQPMWQAGQLATMLGTGNPLVTRSHFEDQASAERAAPAQLRSGWVARHLASTSSATGTFRAITMGNAVTMSLSTNAFESLAMTDIAKFDVNASSYVRSDVLRTLDGMYGNSGGEVNQAADATLAAINGLSDLRTTTYTPANGAVYPDTTFGRGLRDIARLIKAGKGLEAACIDLGGWDHHRGLTDGSAGATFAELARELSESLAAFRLDLGAAWSSTSVVTMSEFGRRVAENGTNGTDHGHGGLMMFAGGGVRGGIYGSQPTLTPSNLTDGDVPILHDYRSGLAELVTKRLANGANLSTVFPDYTPKMPGIFV